MTSIDVNELKRDIGAPAFIAARFALVMSLGAFVLSAVALAVALAK